MDIRRIHAILADTTILEIKQASDITFRLYDYDRLDNDLKRDLHISESMNALTFPDTDNSDITNSYYKTRTKTNVESSKNIANIYWDYIFTISGEEMMNIYYMVFSNTLSHK